MVEKFVCSGGVGRFVRVVLGFILSKLVGLPLLAKVPGLVELLQKPEIKDWLAVILAGLLCGLMKKARDSKKIPGWLPL